MIGALQWPAGQGMPALAASVSVQAGMLATGTVSLLHELNKTLRFAKKASETKLNARPFGKNLSDLCMVAFSDAAFATRHDNSSQGGVVICLCNKSVLNGDLVDYGIISWRSFKLPRVCRSSLSAESQACTAAADELLMMKTFLSLMVDPEQDPRDSRTAKWICESALVIDAKALYDMVKKTGWASGSPDKRVAIEVEMLREEIERLGCKWMWVSSERQLADGMTKLSARQAMLDQLASGRLRLKADVDYIAAKKKTKEDREKDSKDAFGGRPHGRYGSAIAEKIATVVAVASCAQGADAASDPQMDESAHGLPWMTIITLVLLFIGGIATGAFTVSKYVLTWWNKLPVCESDEVKKLKAERDIYRASVDDKNHQIFMLEKKYKDCDEMLQKKVHELGEMQITEHERFSSMISPGKSVKLTDKDNEIDKMKDEHDELWEQLTGSVEVGDRIEGRSHEMGRT